jgi:hypothetical protein
LLVSMIILLIIIKIEKLDFEKKKSKHTYILGQRE